MIYDDERLLDVALDEILRDRVPPDVTDQVLAAVEDRPRPALPERKRLPVAAALMATAALTVLFLAVRFASAPQRPPVPPAAAERPEAVPLPALVAAAERNEERAVVALRAAVARAGDDVDAAQGAGYFALRGDDVGEAVLEHCLREGLELGAPTYFLAAAGLCRLGDEDAWAQAVDTGEEAAQRAVASGDPEAARRIVVAAEYFADSLGGEPVEVAGFVAFEEILAAQGDRLSSADVARRLQNLLR